MRWILVLLCALLCAEESSHEEMAAFRREEELIAGLVSPLTGQIVDKAIDLVVQGAEPLHFGRLYFPRYLSGKHEPFGENCTKWLFVPQLEALQLHNVLYMTDSEGRVCGYYVEKDDCDNVWIRDPSLNFLNTDGQEVHARFDPHNAYAHPIDKNHFCFVTPEGVTQIYTLKRTLPYQFQHRLTKEILPNGKHLRYGYDDGILTSIEMKDPTEQFTYARISLKNDKKKERCYARSSDGREAIYQYTGSLLQRSSSPFHARECFIYDGGLLKMERGSGRDFSLSYNAKRQVETLHIHDDSFYHFSYSAEKNTVTYPDGTKSEHFFNSRFQPEKICFYDEKGDLRREKRYEWENNGRLHALVHPNLARMEYVADKYGNPSKQTLIGDLTGEGGEQSYTVERFFTGKNPDSWFNLLLEKTEETTTIYKYLQRTNLPYHKVVEGKDGLRLVEHRTYDKYYNLTSITIEADGQKRITLIHLKQSHPGLHQPEWIEEYYIENGEKKLLKKTGYSYNQRNLVICEEIYDANDTFAYSVIKQYNDADLLISETNPLGQKAYYEYDGYNRLVAKVPFSEKLRETMTYDLRGRLTSKNCAGKKTFYKYDTADNLVLEINPFGEEKHFVYDFVVKKPKEMRFGETKESFTYDAYGRTLSKTDALGRTTSYKYNAYDAVTEISHPDGSKESFRYYTNGLLKEHIDTTGMSTHFTYDSFKRMTCKRWAGEEERFVYNTLHLLSHTDREGHTTHYSYDGAGRKIREEKCGRVVTYTYNSLGGLETVTQGGVVTRTERDLLGRVTLETKGEVFKKSIVYDAEGNEHIVTTGEDKETFFYDAEKRLVKKIDPLGAVTSITYKEDKVLEKTTIDPMGLKTIETFDTYARLAERRIEKEGLLFRERFFYDLVGNLLRHEEDVFAGKEYKKTLHRLYAYDVCNRRISATVSGRTTQYTYTPKSQVATKTKHDGVVLTYTYTPLGEIETLCSSKGDLDYRFVYDKCGRLLQSEGFTRKLDPFGNILEEDFDGLTVSKTYDDLDRVTSLTLPGLAPINYEYDLYLRAVSYEDQERRYEKYNLSGDLLKESYSSYTRDAKRRITELVTAPFTEECRYDSMDNPLQMGAICYTYDDLSQLSSEKDPFYQETYRFTSHYEDPELPERLEANDPIGRYDSLDRLIECNGYVYTYDALGRRSSKKKELTEHFLYDGLQEIACYCNQNPTAVKIGPPHAPAFFFLEGTITVPLYDAKGALRFLIDPTTHEIYNQYRFTAFGQPLEVLEELFNPWRYALKHYDPESELIYFGKRYYNVHTKRWISEDPAGDIDTLNLYAFVRNNPLRYIDYTGLLPVGVTPSRPFKNFIPPPPRQNIGVYTIFTEGDYELPPDKMLFSINGINCTLEEAKENARMLSRYAGGAKVVGVHIPSGIHGGVKRYLKRREKHPVARPVSDPIAGVIKDFYQRNLDHPDARLLMIPHSGGCREAYDMSALLTEAERDRVSCLALAPCKIIPKNTFYESFNYAVEGDLVVKYAAFREPDLAHRISWLEHIPGESRHSIHSRTFEPVLTRELNSYLNGGL